MTALATFSALVAFVFSILLAGPGHRRAWVAIAVAIAAVVAAALVGFAASPPHFALALFFAPWLLWVPLAMLFGALRRMKAAQSPINRWLYFSAVIAVCIAQGIASDFAVDNSVNPLVILATGAGLVLLTHPAGLVGQALSIYLVHSGIATTAESYLVASPVFAIAGYLQWYVAMPRVLGHSTPLTADQVSETS